MNGSWALEWLGAGDGARWVAVWPGLGVGGWMWVTFLILVLLPVVLGMLAFGGLVLLVFVFPQNFSRNCAWCLLQLVYRIRRHDPERMPSSGGVLLIANHISWLDGFLMLIATSRHVRMIVFEGNFRSRLMQRAPRNAGERFDRPGAQVIVRALQVARRAVQAGEVVGIFPEGGISRSGIMQSFRPGLMRIVEGTDARVMPLYFDGLWGSIFSFERQRFFWKIPRRCRYPIDIHFGQPLESVTALHPIRQAVRQLGAKAVDQRLHRKTELPESVIRACKRRKFKSKVADSAGSDLTGGSLLMRSLILRRLLRREVLGQSESHVGVLLPPSAGAVITNLTLAFDRRVAINLNYTVSSEVMNQCIQLAGIRHVLTSRKVMEKLDFQMDAEVVELSGGPAARGWPPRIKRRRRWPPTSCRAAGFAAGWDCSITNPTTCSP